MTARAFTVAAFSLVGVWALTAHLLGRREGSPVPSLGQLIAVAMVTNTGRAVTMAFWLWIGWHFFVR